MASRIRRFTMTVDKTGAGAQAVAGARDFTYDDQSEWNGDRSDSDGVGDLVRMSTGPLDVGFELLAPDSNVTTGYCKTLVVTAKKITVADGAESSADVIHTFSDGYLKVGANVPTESPGRIPVTGQFKSLAIT